MHIPKWKKPIWDGYTLCDSNYKIFLEKVKLWRQWKNQWLPGAGEEEGWVEKEQRIFKAVKLVYDILMVSTYHHTFVKTYRKDTKNEP